MRTSLKRLTDKVAVVTGASRGAGRGIALVLGEDGATVYVTGRSIRGGKITDNLPGTIQDTAEEVTARGGRGIPVRCDHTSDGEVEALFRKVKHDYGRVDLLVNNVWGGYETIDGKRLEKTFSGPLWEQPIRRWEGMFTAGVRAHLVASRNAVPLMLPQHRGLIISTTIYLHQGRYGGNLFYDISKTAINRMVYGMAKELQPHNIAVIALAPGFMRTERVMTYSPEDLERLGGLKRTESTEYVGRAVASLAADPYVMQKSGSPRGRTGSGVRFHRR